MELRLVYIYHCELLKVVSISLYNPMAAERNKYPLVLENLIAVISFVHPLIYDHVFQNYVVSMICNHNVNSV